MRGITMLCLMLTAGCSSSGAPARAAPPPQQTIRIGSQTARGSTLTIVASGGPHVLTVGVPIDVVWRVLPVVYDSLPVAVELFDPGAHTIGNEGFKVRRQLGKARLSRYLNCGRSQMEPNADEFEVTLAVVTRAAAADSQATTVTTTIEASARGLQFSGQFASCTTTGALEARLQELLNHALLRELLR